MNTRSHQKGRDFTYFTVIRAYYIVVYHTSSYYIIVLLTEVRISYIHIMKKAHLSSRHHNSSHKDCNLQIYMK